MRSLIPFGVASVMPSSGTTASKLLLRRELRSPCKRLNNKSKSTGTGQAPRLLDHLALLTHPAANPQLEQPHALMFFNNAAPPASPVRHSDGRYLSMSSSCHIRRASRSSTLCRGADFHVAIDGNFHHRHQRSAGDSPFFYDSHFVLPKAFVDGVGTRIESARGGRRKAYQPVVPDEAIDDCEKTYEAADGRKQKTSMDHFDDTGLMALVCRHDIPLFLTNIDTPGEQQKYAVALLQHLFSLIPTTATVAAFYDVGCVLDRSLHLVRLSGTTHEPKLISHSTISFPKPSYNALPLPPLPCMHTDMNGLAS